MRADLYVRVSTDEQAEKGYSQRDQEERLRKYCDLKQITIRNVIYEDYSAKTFLRPQWQKILANLKKKRGQVDIILFIKWDRFSRNAGDAYFMINVLRNLGVEPQAMEQPLDLSVPENKMMLAFYLAAPEVENDRRALNTLNGMRRAKKEGRWMGGAPIGYTNKITEDGRKYIAVKQPEASILKWAFEEVAKGIFHIEQIYKEAKLKGLKCCKANFWNSLRNPAYCGKIYIKPYKDEPAQQVRGKHEPIISDSLFYDVQDLLDGKKKTYRTSVGSREELLLRGYLICPKCGKLLTGSASKGRSAIYYYYHCNSTCGVRFRSEITNNLFSKELSKLIPRSGMIEVYSDLIIQLYKQKTNDQREDIKKWTEKVSEHNQNIQKARNKFMMDQISQNDYYEFKKDCEQEIERIDAELVRLSSSVVKIDSQLKQATRNLSNLEQLFENADVRQKKKIIGSIFPEKLIFDGDGFRTARVNEAVQLIFNVDKAFIKNKNGQIAKNFDLSSKVPRNGFEPSHPCERCDLNTVRLPISPPGRGFN